MRGRECNKMASGLALVASSSRGDFVIGRGHARLRRASWRDLV